MSSDHTRIVGTGLLFLLIFISGFWLSKSGKPFNVAILTIHKLISLAAVVFFIVTIYQAHQVATLSAIELTAGVLTGVFFLATMASGGLLSTGKPVPPALLTMHQITPYLTVLSTAATLYLLLGRT